MRMKIFLFCLKYVLKIRRNRRCRMKRFVKRLFLMVINVHRKMILLFLNGKSRLGKMALVLLMNIRMVLSNGGRSFWITFMLGLFCVMFGYRMRRNGLPRKTFALVLLQIPLMKVHVVRKVIVLLILLFNRDRDTFGIANRPVKQDLLLDVKFVRRVILMLMFLLLMQDVISVGDVMKKPMVNSFILQLNRVLKRRVVRSIIIKRLLLVSIPLSIAIIKVFVKVRYVRICKRCCVKRKIHILIFLNVLLGKSVRRVQRACIMTMMVLLRRVVIIGLLFVRAVKRDLAVMLHLIAMLQNILILSMVLLKIRKKLLVKVRKLGRMHVAFLVCLIFPLPFLVNRRRKVGRVKKLPMIARVILLGQSLLPARLTFFIR